MIPLYSHTADPQAIVNFPIPGSDYVKKGIRSYVKCMILHPYALFSHEIVNLHPRLPAGMLSREKAIEYLKIARRHEVHHDLDDWKEQYLQVSEDFLDRLLEAELKERRRVAMAKKIQRVFRAVVANPEYQMCKRRLLREYDELNVLGSA